jgi:ribosome recycling factor
MERKDWIECVRNKAERAYALIKKGKKDTNQDCKYNQKNSRLYKNHTEMQGLYQFSSEV